MSIFTDLFKRRVKPEPPQEERSRFSLGLEYNQLSSYQENQSMRLSAVYCATNMISNSVALLPIKVVEYKDGRKQEIEHPLNKVLNLVPNAKYNKFAFFKLLIECVILRGNGYALIQRDSRLNVKELLPLDPAFVRPVLQPDGSVKYQVEGMSSLVDAENMIHLYMHIDDQFCGISVLRYAIKCLEAAADIDKHADNFFKSGAGLLGILKASAPLSDNQKAQAAASWRQTIMRGNGVAVLPQGLDFQSIQVSPEDAQLLESRKYVGVTELARFFNISPIKLFDYEHVSYSTLEQVSLSYLQDTVLPYTQMIEDEFNRKLFKPSEVGRIGIDFDYAALITADKKSEAEYYSKLISNGIMTINEARAKLGFPPTDDTNTVAGDTLWMQISYGNAEEIARGSYIKQNAQDQGTTQDNKLHQEGENEPTNTKKK